MVLVTQEINPTPPLHHLEEVFALLLVDASPGESCVVTRFGAAHGARLLKQRPADEDDEEMDRECVGIRV